jgi:hypothetical protein
MLSRSHQEESPMAPVYVAVAAEIRPPRHHARLADACRGQSPVVPAWPLADGKRRLSRYG